MYILYKAIKQDLCPFISKNNESFSSQKGHLGASCSNIGVFTKENIAVNIPLDRRNAIILEKGHLGASCSNIRVFTKENISVNIPLDRRNATISKVTWGLPIET